MKRNLISRSIGYSLLICLAVLAAAGIVQAAETAPVPETGLVFGDAAVMKHPDGPGFSGDFPQSKESFLPPESDPTLLGWTKLLQENFDGAFPTAGWTLLNLHPTKDFNWGTDTYRPYSPNQSVHPGGSGADAYDPSDFYYSNDMESWMIYGPLDLSAANDAQLEFQFWLNTETYSDVLWVCASADNIDFYCDTNISGETDGWIFQSFDLFDWNTLGSSLQGDPSVWIALIFESNSSTTGPGVFIDNLEVRSISAGLEPDLLPVMYYLYPPPTLYHPGDSFGTFSRFYNLGTDPCPAYDVAEYLSTDSTVTSGDILVWADSFTGPIDSGESWYASGLPLIPDVTTPGLYSLGVIYTCAGDTNTFNDLYVYPNQIEIAPVGVGGVMVQDNFENHNFRAWTRFNDGNLGLSLCGFGARNGDHGACFHRPPGNDKRRQLIDETPVNQTNFNVRFNFDINSLSMLDGERLRFIQVKMGASRPFFIVLRYQAGQYLIQLNTLRDDLTKDKSGWYLLPDTWQMIEVDWQAASSPGANDGFVRLFLDEVLQEELINLDNDTIFVDTFKVGYTSRMTGKTISGTFYIDDVTTSNGGYIGLP